TDSRTETRPCRVSEITLRGVKADASAVGRVHDNLSMPRTLDRDIQAGRRVALAGIAASTILATLNLIVGFITQSASVVATGAEFAGDVLASTVVLLGMIAADKPADEQHPYGHGRIE